jgi:hypothetical protein
LFLLIAALAIPVGAQAFTTLVLYMLDDGAGLPGVVFEIYRVGSQSESGELVLEGDFAEYPVILGEDPSDMSAQAAALYAFAKRDDCAPAAFLKTNVIGIAEAADLEAGLYLIGGRPQVHNGYLYHTEPQLIALPYRDPVTGLIMPKPELRVKYSKEAYTQQLISRKVLKIWDDVSGLKRPESVTVHLLKDGDLYSTVTLSAENQWRYEWNDLEANALWQIAEDVPDGYTVTVEQEGTTFLMTNTAPEFPPPETDPPDEPGPGGNIPQTGMILWPVFLLAGLGIVCIVAGVCLRKGSAYEA